MLNFYNKLEVIMTPILHLSAEEGIQALTFNANDVGKK